MIGSLWSVARGTVAWIVGYLVTVALAVVGAVENGGGLVGGTAAAFVDAHAVPPAADGESLALLAAAAIPVAVAGYRAGARREAGLLGRVRSLLDSFRGGESRRRYALRTGLALAVGYALVTGLVAVPLATGVGVAAASAFAIALVVAAPATYVGVTR